MFLPPGLLGDFRHLAVARFALLQGFRSLLPGRDVDADEEAIAGGGELRAGLYPAAIRQLVLGGVETAENVGWRPCGTIFQTRRGHHELSACCSRMQDLAHGAAGAFDPPGSREHVLVLLIAEDQCARRVEQGEAVRQIGKGIGEILLAVCQLSFEQSLFGDVTIERDEPGYRAGLIAQWHLQRGQEHGLAVPPRGFLLQHRGKTIGEDLALVAQERLRHGLRIEVEVGPADELCGRAGLHECCRCLVRHQEAALRVLHVEAVRQCLHHLAIDQVDAGAVIGGDERRKLPHHRHRACHLSLFGKLGPCREAHVDSSAVLVRQPCFEIGQRMSVADPGQQVRFAGSDRVLHDLCQRQADHLVSGKAQDALGGRVPCGHHAIDRLGDDTLRAGLHKSGEQAGMAPRRPARGDRPNGR